MRLAFWRTNRDLGDTPNQLIPQRSRPVGNVTVNSDMAMRIGAVWACLRLRADLVSTMPLDVYREVGGIKVQVPKPPVLVNPGGERIGIQEWLYDTQFDLDRVGNTFGLITARDGMGLPARIDLVPFLEVTVRMRKGVTSYLIAGKEHAAEDVWHERQFTTSGSPVGLNPVMYAALTEGGYLSASQFLVDWFTKPIPGGQLKNTQREFSADDAESIKDRFRASVLNGDVFVTGSDWDFTFQQIPDHQSQFLASMKYNVADVCRFFGVPGDMIDAESSTGSITYANVTQRNLQFLIMNLGPAIVRRETALSSLLSKPRYVKFNTDALLRMDTATRYQSYGDAIRWRFMLPSEVRHLEDRLPYEQADFDEFAKLFPPPAKALAAPNAAQTAADESAPI